MGDALVGDFTAQSSADEILLVNHMDEQNHELEDTQARDHLLVKKSVLICKKHAADKHSIHRLRVEEPASKDRARGSKRSRNSREKEESSASVRYIERIKFGFKQQRASGHGHSGDEADGDARSNHLVSQSQLVQLMKSLEKRLENGIRELDRLKLIVTDKRDMVHRLNHFVEDEWWRSQQNGDGTAGRLLISAVDHGEQRELRSESMSEIAMQTLVSASEATQRADGIVRLSPAYSLKSLVTLEDFRIVEYIPAASIFRLQMTLRNRSPHSLRHAFVSLVSETTNANGLSSATVSKLQSSSSVQLEFVPAKANNSKGLASFVLDAQLPPSFAMLRGKQSVKASVWLHCNSSDSQLELRASSLKSDTCSFQVGSVDISPHEFVFSHDSAHRQRSLSQTAKGTNLRLGSTILNDLMCVSMSLIALVCLSLVQNAEVEKLLLVSFGSSLTHIFQTRDGNELRRSPIHLLQTLTAELVRPSFALTNLAMRERELSKYELSQFVSSLPSDVCTMLNPLQEHHLRHVVALLQSIRMELVVIQRRSVNGATESNDDDEDGMGVDASRTHQQWQLLTDFRRMQKSTDLRAAELLHDLQRRANFHSMWFGAP